MQARCGPGSACSRAGGSTCWIPSALDIEIADIAHGLARVARWNGQTEGAHSFSVAQHSLLVERLAARRARLDRRAGSPFSFMTLRNM